MKKSALLSLILVSSLYLATADAIDRMRDGFPDLPKDAQDIAERSLACQHFWGEANGTGDGRDKEVLDLYSRRIIGWSMQSQMTAQLVTDALMMAVWRRGRPESVMHHSDRGSQYTSDQFQRLLAELGVTCSMSRSGNCWDNSAMESFFKSL